MEVVLSEEDLHIGQVLSRQAECGSRSRIEIDLFASRLTAQFPLYMSWKPDPGSAAIDALNQKWSKIKGYAFPSFSLIGRCLAEMKQEKVPEFVLITPV